ncbi:MAG: chorismate mutase [Fibrobacteres bacterium]|nr:chorismate mutase [Fibrobacterota bacterium]
MKKHLSVSSKLKPLRSKIDKINTKLLDLLNKRVGVAQIIGRIKSQEGAPVSDSAREQSIIDNLKKRNRGPLDDVAVEKIFRTVINETKRIERIAHSESKSAPGKKA